MYCFLVSDGAPSVYPQHRPVLAQVTTPKEQNEFLLLYDILKSDGVCVCGPLCVVVSLCVCLCACA